MAPIGNNLGIELDIEIRCMLKERFGLLKNFLLDLLFPKECLGCGSEGTYFCEECLKKIEIHKDLYCALCKKTSPAGMICENCRGTSNLRAIWVSADYNNVLLQNLIHFLKYRYVEELADTLASLAKGFLTENQIIEKFNITSENTFLVPVPLHKTRQGQRGFNQSELISRKLSEHYNLQTKDLLHRNKNTASQINLKRTERQENIRDAFEIGKENFDTNKKIILIDDVVTTGSTLNECAKILNSSGFNEIYGLVIAQRED